MEARNWLTGAKKELQMMTTKLKERFELLERDLEAWSRAKKIRPLYEAKTREKMRG